MRTAEPEDRGRGRYARTQQHAPTLGAIVYLAQTRHNSYARDSMGMLRQSVKLLHTHYNARQRDDVLFLHAPDGNVSEQHQQQLVAMCRPAVLDRWRHEGPNHASHVAERWNESLFSVPSASSSKESKGTLLVRLRDRELLRRNLKCDRSLGGGGPAVMRFLMGGRPKGEAELARMVMEQPDAKHGLNGAALRLGRGILT